MASLSWASRAPHQGQQKLFQDARTKKPVSLHVIATNHEDGPWPSVFCLRKADADRLLACVNVLEGSTILPGQRYAASKVSDSDWSTAIHCPHCGERQAINQMLGSTPTCAHCQTQFLLESCTEIVFRTQPMPADATPSTDPATDPRIVGGGML